MTDITINRAVVEQALEALEDWDSPMALPAMVALRAALAQQAEPVLQTCNCRWDGDVQVQQCTLHEAHVDAIHEWAERAKVAERKLAQQAEPVEPVAWRDSDNSDPGQGCTYDKAKAARWPHIYKQPLYTAPPQQAEPVQKPITHLFGTLPVHDAQQAEPVEPVAYRHLHEDGWEYHDAPTGEDCAECQALYTAPAQRKPLPKHDQHCVDVPGYGLMAVRLVRAVERAHGIKE